MKNKTALIILDGWGVGNGSEADAISNAQVPFYRKLISGYPHAQLLTSGKNVGLPDGQMGNSEVGHLNIGAGRIVYQDLVKINLAIENKSFFKEKVLVRAMEKTRENKKALHLLGLVSDGGVHSSAEHLKALCLMAENFGLEQVYIHFITDGRDTDPKSGLGFARNLEIFIQENNLKAKVVSLIGRYYAMDRDKRWERVKKAYDLLVNGMGRIFNSIEEAILFHYSSGITDEFIEASIIGKTVTVNPDDSVICFNFRTDRCREITQVLTQFDMPEIGMKTLPLHYVTMTRYDETFKGIEVVYEKDNLNETLGEVIANSGRTQLRIAETEKYPHVTFFFNGGRELPFEGENRIMIPSPKVATYDLQPEMSAAEVCAAVCKSMSGAGAPDFVCLNFANPDMVGHTGVYSAVLKALETVDSCLKTVVETGLQHGYAFVIIADHGNADYMMNADGSPNTAHTTNPVPVILISDRYTKITDGILADIAPTILKLMDIPSPSSMTGKSLIS